MQRICFAVATLMLVYVTRNAKAQTCVATCDAYGNCTPGCNGSSSSSSAADDARYQAAMEAEKELFRRIDAEEKARRQAKEREMARRNANVRGVQMAKKKAWTQALKLLEAAQAQFPDDNLIATNLAAVRSEIEAEKARADAKIAEAKARADAKIAEAKAREAALSAPIQIPQRFDAPSKQIEEVVIRPVRMLSVRPPPSPAPQPPVATTPPENAPQPVAMAPPESAWRADARRTLDVAKARALEEGLVHVTRDVPGVDRALGVRSFVDTFNRATAAAQEIVGIIDEAAINTTVMMVGGETDATIADVTAAPQRAARIVFQFVGEELLGSVWTAGEPWLLPEE